MGGRAGAAAPGREGKGRNAPAAERRRGCPEEAPENPHGWLGAPRRRTTVVGAVLEGGGAEARWV
jgi:hypothetical protein